MLDAEASNIDAFLSRDTCVSSNQLKRPICSKYSLSLTFKHISGRKYCF
jgi:hypothetical protein